MTRARLSHLLSFCLIISFWITAVGSAFGELTADHVAILANRNSPDSLAVARHYATRRSIPPDRILELDLPTQETINRKEYEERVIVPVREQLTVTGLAPRIHALVTTYGMPLRVEAPQPSESERRWIQDATERQRFARAYLAQILDWAKRVAPSSSEGVPSSPPTPQAIEDDRALMEHVHRAIRDAGIRVNQAESRERGATAGQWKKELARIIVQVGGTAALLQQVQAGPGAPQGTQANLEALRRKVASAQTAVQTLADAPSDKNRKQAYQLTQKLFGLEGILRLATAEIEAYSYKDGDASLDSELSLLWWDRDQYRVAGRIPNPLFHENPALADPSRSLLPIVLVSRLDAPTPQLAMSMVDRAIETEERGLTGKAYIDSRGIHPDGTIGYGYYDQGLRDLADLLQKHGPYPVVLEDTERRFSQRGEAPGVALYVGWYKLRSYEDAFTFNPGAIGYHIASGEAVSVHDPKETGWCKNALERGITVTLGPIGEPYVDAFPLPNEFVALLLTGRYSLAEAYALTTRYVSWRMVLFGDPLYNPWRGRGLLAEEETVLRHIRSGQATLAIAPFALPFNDPLKARREMTHRRETALAQAQAVAAELSDQNRKRTR